MALYSLYQNKNEHMTGSYQKWYARPVVTGIKSLTDVAKEIQENTAFDENDDEAKQKREDEEWMAHVYSQALAELKRTVKPRKLQSFMMCRLQNKRPEDVAKFQKVSLATIYNDCNEVMEKLTELVKTLKDA